MDKGKRILVHLALKVPQTQNLIRSDLIFLKIKVKMFRRFKLLGKVFWRINTKVEVAMKMRFFSYHLWKKTNLKLFTNHYLMNTAEDTIKMKINKDKRFLRTKEKLNFKGKRNYNKKHRKITKTWSSYAIYEANKGKIRH